MELLSIRLMIKRESLSFVILNVAITGIVEAKHKQKRKLVYRTQYFTTTASVLREHAHNYPARARVVGYIARVVGYIARRTCSS